MARKTIAARILEEAGVACDVVAYDVDEEAFSAEAVAVELGLPAEQMFKTLVAIGDRTGPFFAVVPAGANLDLKALAAVTGNRKMELAPLAELRALTGYARGSVTVMGARKAYPVIVDETVQLFERFGVSGGAKGIALVLAPGDYLAVTGARLADITR